MMFEASKLLLDRKISRHTLISGMSLAGATTIANALTDRTVSAATNGVEKGRIVENLTGGEVMVEFLLDWKIHYAFDLAGSEKAGFLDAIVDRTQLQYVTCLHEGIAVAMTISIPPAKLQSFSCIP